MSQARHDFIERLSHFKNSLTIDALNDKASIHVMHNNIARILRNGLAVVGFVSLEDYIKRKSGEYLSEISTFNVVFDDLPEKIRFTVTVDVLSALARIVKNEATVADKISFMQSQTLKISSTANSAFNLTEYAYGYKSSNINADDILSILSSFYVKDGWRIMSNISSRIGLTALPLDNSFKNAANRRHNAAHVAKSNTPINDLSQYVSEALGIAISFDCLLRKAINFIKKYDKAYLSGKITVDGSHVKLSFIKYEKDVWKYRRENVAKAVKINANKKILLAAVLHKVQLNEETLIVFDEHNHVENWID